MLSGLVIEFIKNEQYERIYFSVFDQLMRSGTSICANLVAGGGSNGKKELINYYHISLKSANETKYWLCLIRDNINCNKEKVQVLITEADELSKIIAAGIIKMKGLNR